MKEGFWLNAANGKFYPVHDHALWLQDMVNLCKAGFCRAKQKQLVALNPFRDRVKMLKLAMAKGFIRVRGHGEYTTFEFAMPQRKALRAIHKFARRLGIAGTGRLRIVNLKKL